MTTGADPWRLIDGRGADSATTRLRVRSRIGMARLLDTTLCSMGATAPVVFVSGFWRSGTTWLQECLAETLRAKTVFEPLSPLHEPRGAELASRFAGDEDAAQAFIPDTACEGTIVPHLDRAMAGRADSDFAMSCRWTVRESFRRSVVVKDVRAQCHLGLVHARYGVPLVHIRRHPCAAVSSLMRARWHWSFARVRLTQLMSEPRPADRNVADPRRFDDNEMDRIAAYWAWSERRAAHELEGQPWGCILTYEALTRDPHRAFGPLCAKLGLRQRAPIRFDQPSASVDPVVLRGQEGGGNGWRRHLSPPEIERIETVATAVYPEWRQVFDEVSDLS